MTDREKAIVMAYTGYAMLAEDKLDVLVTKSLDEANALKFETDLMIAPAEDKLTFTLEPLRSSGRSPFTLTLTAEKNGNVVLYGAGIAETVIGRSGEWIHLKIEYMNPELDYNGDGDRDILVRVYVGNSNTHLVTGYKPNSASSHYSPLNLEKMHLGISKESYGSIYLDNTMLWQESLAPDEGGVPPIEKTDEPIGDTVNTLDKNGWV